MKPTIRQRFVQLWISQFCLLAVAILITWFTGYPVLAKSILIGGIIYWIPNAYFAFYAFRYRGAQATAYVLRSMYRGEFGKFVLTGVGFAIVFTSVEPLNPGGLFTAFIGMTVWQWLFTSRWQ